jgi:hypothetical protein
MEVVRLVMVDLVFASLVACSIFVLDDRQHLDLDFVQDDHQHLDFDL